MTPDKDLKDNDSEINGLLIIDRTTDLISPFALQWTYEGLLDETFGITSAQTEIPANIAESKHDDSKIKLDLVNDTPNYEEIRDVHLNSLKDLIHMQVYKLE